MQKGFSVQVFLMLSVLTCILLVISIPFTIKTYQKSQYVNGLKKAYNEFNEALLQLTQDKDCGSDLKCTKFFKEGTTDKTFGDALVKNFKVLKNCGVTPGQGCFASYTNENYDGSSSKVYELDQWDGYRFITRDGMSFYVWNYAKDCTDKRSTGATGNLEQACGEIYVDTNGPDKGPNYMGIDTFNFWISNGKGATLYPMGGRDTKWSDQDWRWKSSNNVVQHCYSGEKTGWPCAGRIIEEGWQMKY